MNCRFLAWTTQQAAKETVQPMAARQKRKTALSSTVKLGTGTVKLLIVSIYLYAMSNSINSTFSIMALPLCTGQIQKYISFENLIAGRIPTQQQTVTIRIEHLRQAIVRQHAVILRVMLVN
jgi:hypothetical protein